MAVTNVTNAILYPWSVTHLKSHRKVDWLDARWTFEASNPLLGGVRGVRAPLLGCACLKVLVGRVLIPAKNPINQIDVQQQWWFWSNKTYYAKERVKSIFVVNYWAPDNKAPERDSQIERLFCYLQKRSRRKLSLWCYETSQLGLSSTIFCHK